MKARKMMTNLEPYLRALKGVTNILRPHKGTYQVIVGNDGKIGMKITTAERSWTLSPKRYATEDALISAMWTFAEQVWARLQTKTTKDQNHG
jgi:hypothetical protein